MDEKKRPEGLTSAFENGDRDKIVKLTSELPAHAQTTVPSVLRVFKEQRGQGMTPFISAILHGNRPLCELLIEDGIDMGFPVNEQNNELNIQSLFMNLLLFASSQIENGHSEIVFEGFKHTNPMFWAIKCNSPELVLKLLNHGYGKDSPVENVFDLSPLLLAVTENKEKVVQVLLNNSAGLHYKDPKSATALDLAIEHSLIDMVKLLMQHGEDPNCRHHSQSPLITAIINNLDMMKCLVELGANIDVAWIRDRQIPPLHFAILNLPRCANAAVWLIKNGADVKLKYENGNTPLHSLAWSLDFEWKVEVTLEKCRIAQALLEKGAEVDAKNSVNTTPLCGAVSSLNIELFDVLLSAGADININQGKDQQSILHTLVSFMTIARINGFDETESVNNNKLLMKHLSFIRVLLKKGAHVNAKDKHGKSPLHLASTGKDDNFDIVKLLVEGGADINCQDDLGLTPLSLSILATNLKLVQYLIEHGACVNKTNHNMISPLEVGLDSKHYQIFKCLIQAGADVNTMTRHGNTPLHIAAEQLNLSFVNILIESGADIKSTDCHGNLALDYCILNPNRPPESVQIFLDYGFDVNLQDRFEMTSYDYVMLRKRSELLKMFWRHGCPLKIPEVDIKNGESKYFLKLTTFDVSFRESVAKSERTIDKQKNKQLLITQSKFMTGIKENNLELVLSALKEGAEPKGCSQEIMYPLHYLAKRGCREVLKVLLDKGVNTNVLDKNGDTPLQLAARQGDVQICQMLLQHGACFSKAASKKLSPGSSQDNLPSHQKSLHRLFRKIRRLFRFARRGNVSLLKHLTDNLNDKDPSIFWSLMNCIDNRGDTLLASAVRGGHENLADKLMRLRLSFND